MSFNELKLWRATKGAWWWEQKARTKLNKVQTRMTRCIRGKMQETGVVTVAPGVSALHGIPRLSHPVISCHSSCCTITQNISPCTAGLNIPTSYKPSESADILYISVKVSFYSLCHNPGLNLTSASSQPFFILFIILFKGMNIKKKKKKEKKKEEIQIYQRWWTKSNFSESGSRLLQQFFTERRIQRFETQHISQPSLKNIKREILGFGCATAKSS